jgi:hypothetical protein
MELLAILSTIILVGTVATLILAVASYILYKARERRNSVGYHSPQMAPAMQQHVLTAPANGFVPRALPMGVQQPIQFADAGVSNAPQHYAAPRPAQAATYVPPQNLRVAGATQPANWEYGAEAFAPVRRNDAHDAVPGRSQSDDLAWLG